MASSDTQRAMQRYFDALGTDRFGDAVASEVTWTVMDSGEVVQGASDVAEHLDALHGSMLGTRTRDLMTGEGVAVLEGDAAVLGRPAERIAFCVVYDVRDGLVTAMRVYGDIESAVARRS